MPRVKTAPPTLIAQTEQAKYPALPNPEPVRRHAYGLGTISPWAEQNTAGRAERDAGLAKTSEDTVAGWARGLIYTIQTSAKRMMAYYDRALDDGTVRPDSIPMGIALLLSKRLELQAEVATMTPSATHTPADTLLLELCSEPGPDTIDNRIMPTYPEMPTPAYPPQVSDLDSQELS